MTDPTASTPAASSPAAGWYPDPAGSAGERYWSGSEWTSQVRERAAAAPAPAAPAAQPQSDLGVPRYEPYRAAPVPGVAAGTSVSTPWIWVIVLLPIISTIAIAAFDVRGYLLDSIRIGLTQADPSVVPQFPSLGGYLLLNLLSVVLYGATVVFAYLDFRALKSRGVQRPFHWAWAFLGVLVYVIGRSVIVYRRSRSGLAPLWVLIGMTVLSFVVTLVKIADAVAGLDGVLPGTGGFS